jgi:hypothetical protein
MSAGLDFRFDTRIDTVAKLAAVFGVEPWRLLKRHERPSRKPAPVPA